jgi:radical SAM superfamily enzyme YgiQ (UPF0313 family)
MSETTVVLSLTKGRAAARVEGTRVTFSPHQCFRFDGGPEDTECLRALGAHLQTLPGLVLCGAGPLLDHLLRQVPELQVRAALAATPDGLPSGAQNVFLCDTRMVERLQMRRRLPPSVKVVEPDVLAEIAPDSIPARGWTPLPRNIYPIELPEIRFRPGLDLILIDCPSRNLALMPNGLAYVHNALKKTSASYQIFDLDIVAYHRFHMHRLYDAGGRVVLPSGTVLPEDPWQAEHYDVWSMRKGSVETGGTNEILEFFRPLIDETIAGLVEARPRILGLSIQQCNEAISREIVRGVKARLPDTVILVGGFSCYNADIGLRAFPECDYMCIGEADLTVGPLVEALASGERPRNQPGVLSRFDTPDYRYIPAPMVHNLDQIEFPKYEWCDLGLYRNFNDYQLTPIIASRGCRWSRCTFCAERFYWRIRSPQNFVDELEWLVDRGCHLFMFNESDLNGMPERVMEICDEIIRRGLQRKVKLTGQLRIHKKNTRAFFDKLRAANFVALRFGVDAFSANTLRLQKKGYTVEMVCQNLRDCWETGIYTEVNWVIGVPGETDADVEEGIALILRNQKYIGRLANINPLIMVNGGVYWIDPEAHNIVFREPKEQLYARHPRALPADTWYSTEPYIDAQVRKERFGRIVLALHEAGFPVGAWANRVIEDVKLARDPNRAGSGRKMPAPAEQAAPAVALEISSQSAPASEADAPGRKVIPIRSADEGNAKEAGKPAAEPPLHGVAGEPPKHVRRMESHDVVFHNGWYYGVPHALGKVDLTDPDPSRMAGVIKDVTEAGVVAIIEEASHWADTRGQYDAQEKQRAAGSYMRAGSALGEKAVSALPEKPKVLRFHGEYIMVDRQALKDAFSAPRFASRGRADAGRDARNAPPLNALEARSLLRRLAAALSPAIRQEIRRLIRTQSLSSGKASGPLVTWSDSRLLVLLWRGAIDSYLKKPLARFFGNDSAQAGVAVTGEDFHIISSVTRHALPELLWAINDYNLVKFDGRFYGIPHGVPVDWDESDIASIPGVLHGRSIREAVALVERVSGKQVAARTDRAGASRASGPAGETSSTPVQLGVLEDHDLISYEGWVYGIPRALGAIDLTEVDVMELPGVIRDVSRDVVENEILERARSKQQVAA